MNNISLNLIKELLEKNKLSPLKKLGQNFLIDSNITEKIASSIPDSSNVIEIGPGLGSLTSKLAEKAKNVVAIDIDSGMIRVLSELFAGCKNVHIVHADILKTDLDETAKKYFGDSEYHVCGNLPYYITAKCLLKICESGSASMTAMVQKEVAERIVSEPGTKDYGILTASLAYYASPKTLFTVSRNCFYPVPDVESAVISSQLGVKLINADRKAYISTVKGCFAQRRKTIFNNISSSFRSHSKEEIREILAKLNIPETERAENLTPQQFADLSKMLF